MSYISAAVSSGVMRIFNHFYVIRLESYRIRWNYDPDMAMTPFKVIQGHRVWYQSKAHMRFPISD